MYIHNGLLLPYILDNTLRIRPLKTDLSLTIRPCVSNLHLIYFIMYCVLQVCPPQCAWRFFVGFGRVRTSQDLYNRQKAILSLLRSVLVQCGKKACIAWECVITHYVIFTCYPLLRLDLVVNSLTWLLVCLSSPTSICLQDSDLSTQNR